MTIVESNCLEIVKVIATPLFGISSFDLLVNNCKSLLAILSNVQVDYVKRSANATTHSLH